MDSEIYFTTHTRASPWLIGVLFGYYLHVNRGKKFKLSPLTVWIGWIGSLAIIFACLFGLYPYAANGTNLPKLDESFYVTLTRVAWPLALVWVVFACKYGYGGMANSFLSSPMWQPLSKLSYCAYIFHLFFESLHAGMTHTNTYFTNYQVVSIINSSRYVGSMYLRIILKSFFRWCASGLTLGSPSCCPTSCTLSSRHPAVAWS